jgi:DNA replication protein DnaC
MSKYKEKKDRTCEKHGDYHGYVCTPCCEEREAQELKDKRLEFVKVQNARLDLPPRFKNAGFKNFEAKTDKQKQTVTEINKYAKSIINRTHKGGFLSLLGGVGTGKTHLACALARNLIQNGLTVKYQTTNQIIATMAMAKQNYTTDMWAEINRLTQFDMLIIDEIGTQDAKDNNYLFELVNKYYGAVKPMVLVSNYGLETLKANTGERVVDRMKHNGVILGLDWESYRK